MYVCIFILRNVLGALGGIYLTEKEEEMDEWTDR